MSRADPFSAVRAAIADHFLADESACLKRLLLQADSGDEARQRIVAQARELVAAIRAPGRAPALLDALLQEYQLSSQEGMVLMCIAEALLRIPDAHTADRLIADKLAQGNWDDHRGRSDSLLVNASTWGLMLTGTLLRFDTGDEPRNVMGKLFARGGEPLIRMALRQAMGILGQQFVMGRSIAEALTRSRDRENRVYRHSYDMLGEAALTERDAQRYLHSYAEAIRAIGAARGDGDVFSAPSISLKLSALHPRYEWPQRERVLAELTPRLMELATLARDLDIGLTLDAEEADRLELSLDIFASVLDAPELNRWHGLGLAVQAYQKRAPYIIAWLAELARSRGKRIPVRLVKGAYWDTEIKRAQERGLAGYPVYTRKSHTDVAYLACARALLGAPDAFYPQFATHNAHTVAAILAFAGTRQDYEFQRLHGMGKDLYAQIVPEDKLGRPCRVYAPVGSHEDLLPYLVRRLLENGANTSFVHRLADPRTPVENVIADPVDATLATSCTPHSRIPLPGDIYAARINSPGVDLSDEVMLASLRERMQRAMDREWRAAPLINGQLRQGRPRAVTDPADRRRVIGYVTEADEEHAALALEAASASAGAWDRSGAEYRATMLENAAGLFEKYRAEFIALLIRESGKCFADAQAEWRETVDYCRYYAMQARDLFGAPRIMRGPTGERNELHLHGRGVFACVSPWNFPLAIFTGQIVAALAAGNAVVAKPARQTPLVAFRAVQLLHEAGVPHDVLHFLPGPGNQLGAVLCADARISGVAFTGSTATAWSINRTLASRSGAIAPLIAETGGQNCLIADSSALPEQVVKDALVSAYNSAGQRCSALRVLFLHDEIAPRIIELLVGALAELKVGDPWRVDTDVGPVIDEAAREALVKHAQRMDKDGELIAKGRLGAETESGVYFAPRLYEIEDISLLEGEVFGPILHVIRYRADRLDEVINAINRTGYGLTLGIHSRVDETVRHIRQRVRAGNCYVNRNVIGAVVGVQPFGGEGLSGTGPKAGGPHYLLRFATERTLTINTAALGGNTSLLELADERI